LPDVTGFRIVLRICRR